MSYLCGAGHRISRGQAQLGKCHHCDRRNLEQARRICQSLPDWFRLHPDTRIVLSMPEDKVGWCVSVMDGSQDGWGDTLGEALQALHDHVRTAPSRSARVDVNTGRRVPYDYRSPFKPLRE